MKQSVCLSVCLCESAPSSLFGINPGSFPPPLISMIELKMNTLNPQTRPLLGTPFFFIFNSPLSSVTSMASTCGLHLQLSSLLSTCQHPNLYVPDPSGRCHGRSERKKAKTFPWEESLLGGCWVRQKVDISLRSNLFDHHTPKIMAAPLHVAQGKSSSFIQVGSSTLDNTGRRG